MGLPNMGAGGAVGFLSGGNTPQDWNQGIQNAPFTPYSTGPGTVQGGDPYQGSRMQMGPFGQLYNEYGQNLTPYSASGQAMTQSPLSMDFLSPGVGEQWQQQNQHRFTDPTQSSNYFQYAMGNYGQPPQGTNFSQSEYQNFNRPNIANDPGLDPYYNRAADRLSNQLNNQFASRGMFGSSAALDQLSEGLGGLAAEQANREAQYNLQRLGEQRAWEALGGQLAGQADANSRAGNQQDLAWLMGLGNLAGQADQANLANLMGGMDVASTAQNLHRGRGQDYFNQTMGPAMAMAGMVGDSYNDMLGTDAQLMNNALMMESGLAQAALNQSYRTQDRHKADAEWAKGMMGGGKGKGK